MRYGEKLGQLDPLGAILRTGPQPARLPLILYTDSTYREKNPKNLKGRLKSFIYLKSTSEPFLEVTCCISGLPRAEQLHY